MLRVHSIETFGTHEGPGIRMVVFLQGCHFRCLYCHNPDTWKLDGGNMMSVEAIVQKANQERAYFGKKGGVTISGGEPLIQRVQLLPLLRSLRAQHIHSALDTNGYFTDIHAQAVMDTIDLVLLDIKHIDEQKHIRLTGHSNAQPIAFAHMLEKKKIPMWLRYVFVPGVTDDPQDLHAWGSYFSHFSNIQRVEILPYHTLGAYKYDKLNIPYPLKGVHPPSQEMIKCVLTIFNSYFPTVVIR